MYHPDLIRHPDSCPALVLNADYTPLSYYPLSVWPWQTAIKAVFLERVDIISNYEREVHSPSGWSPEFFGRLRDVDADTAAAVDQLLAVVRRGRRSKKPLDL